MNCTSEIIPYVMTWEGVVTNYRKKYSKELKISDSIEAYIHTIVLKKTLESISFDYRREDLIQSESPSRPAKVDVEDEILRNTGTQPAN